MLRNFLPPVRAEPSCGCVWPHPVSQITDNTNAHQPLIGILIWSSSPNFKWPLMYQKRPLPAYAVAGFVARHGFGEASPTDPPFGLRRVSPKAKRRRKLARG